MMVAFASALQRHKLQRLGQHCSSLPLLALALPIGISFWTFATIAYLIDIARGTLSAERNFLRYALFTSLFAHVTAGPIARVGQLLPQLSAKHRFSYEGMRSGLLLMLWGFFKKLVVADPLGVVVNTVYGKPIAFGNRPVLLAFATVAFSIQLYCDFSGYTDIVRGSARLYGIDLMRNFNRPYAADSVKEFWRRWHMTLMSWFRDYVYIPLGGSRVSRGRRYANIMAVFLVSGLWHGAGLTFVVWGLLNGAYQVFGELLAPARERAIVALRIQSDGRFRHALAVLTTFALITLAWVFFRAETLREAVFILSHVFSPAVASPAGLAALGDLGLSWLQLDAALIAAVLVFVLEWLSTRTDLPATLFRQRTPVRWAVYYAAILTVVIFGFYGPVYSAASFAYFKF